MAKTVEIKIAADIEYRVIGNAFGLLIASAGLLAGEMIRLQSIDYWVNDIVALLLLVWMGFRLFKNFLLTMNVYQNAPVRNNRPVAPGAASLQSENSTAGQITAKPSYSTDKVIEEVSKRIEAQKAEALKKSKFNN